MPVGKELKRLRLSAKLSVAKFAGFICVDPERLRNWERRDGRPIEKSDIDAIENYFDVPIDKLHTVETFEVKRRRNGQLHPNQDAKIISLLEDKVNILEEQVNYLKTSLGHQLVGYMSIVLTNQDLLIELCAHVQKIPQKSISLKVGKANAANYQKLIAEKGKNLINS
jgi:transcriptional regulator with XRE-family HTH domain